MDSWVGTLLALGLGILFVALGYPMYRRMVGPNTIYGFRTVQTISDPDVWYPVNERSGKHLIIIGLVLIVVGALSLIVARSESRQQIIIGIALLISLGGAIASAVVCYRMAKQLAAERKAQ